MRRLALCGFILIVTALDFRYGHPAPGLQIAGLVAGLLLALTVIIDHVSPDAGQRMEPKRNGENHPPCPAPS